MKIAFFTFFTVFSSTESQPDLGNGSGALYCTEFVNRVAITGPKPTCPSTAAVTLNLMVIGLSRLVNQGRI